MAWSVSSISQEKLDIAGKVKISTMDVSDSDSIVVWGADGTLSMRSASALIKALEDRIFDLEYSLGKDSISDIDGNNYKIVKIGTQYWMAENLRTTRYRDGSAIDSANSNGQWTTNVTNGKWCWYNGDSATYEVPYGKLYNWYAVDDSLGLCPSGWHVPSDDVAGGDSEWQILTDFLTNNGYGYGGSGNDIGKSMAATFGWTSSVTAGYVGNDQGSNNSSGFSGLPGGGRGTNGTFGIVGNDGYWWSSSQSNTDNAWYRNLDYSIGNVDRASGAKELGFSVRCLRD